MYWEGQCPEWIRQCQHTVCDHAQDVRLLSTEEFDRMWDSNCGIDLSKLYVAHRADFIRAFLLARFGGLWVDSDCVVVESLEPVLELLEKYGFLGYSQGHGLITNNFIGSCPDSPIAADYYERVYQILRSGIDLEWLTLGASALTDTLRETRQPWYQIPPELVEPISVSDAQSFFALDSREGHDDTFNSRAICYMLSNHVVGGYVHSHPGVDLLAEGTFFRYLLARSAQTSLTAPSTIDRIMAKDTTELSTAIGAREALTEGLYRIATACGHGSVLVSTGPDNGWKLRQSKDANKNDTAQLWRVIRVDDGKERNFSMTNDITVTNRYQIENVATGMVLGVDRESREDKASILCRINKRGAHKQWWLVPAGGDDTFRIVNVHSGKAIDIFDANPHDDAEIIQMPYHSPICQQKWKLITVTCQY
jgi:hypothetical protein